MRENCVTEAPPPRLAPGGLKLKDAAAYLGGISTLSLRRLIERGLIRPNRTLRHIIISREELDRFLAS
jgi:excisionase family DNA binding protein